jgi:hypothetical protein
MDPYPVIPDLTDINERIRIESGDGASRQHQKDIDKRVDQPWKSMPPLQIPRGHVQPPVYDTQNRNYAVEQFIHDPLETFRLPQESQYPVIDHSHHQDINGHGSYDAGLCKPGILTTSVEYQGCKTECYEEISEDGKKAEIADHRLADCGHPVYHDQVKLPE